MTTTGYELNHWSILITRELTVKGSALLLYCAVANQ
jgi:hypothetical protein